MRQRAILYGLHLLLLLTAGCSGFWQTPPEPQESQSNSVTAEVPPEPEQALLQEEPAVSSELEVSRTTASSAPPATPPPVAEPSSAQSAPVIREVSSAKPAASPVASSPAPETTPIKPGAQEGETLEAVPAEEPVKEPAKEPVKEPAREPAPPPLDLDSLEQRLRETKAIGVFTKLALKNQVDDLLDKFRDFYQGRSNASLAQLRQPYEMLIMKVLALLQDSDPRLANDLVQSREAIWKVLADREKFISL